MKNVFIFILVLSMPYNAICKSKCGNMFYFDMFGIMLNSDASKSKIKSNRIKKIILSKDSSLVFLLKNCSGSSEVSLYVEGTLRLRSFYSATDIYCDSTLSLYNRKSGNYIDYMGEYLVPCKSGTWEYFDENNKLSKVEIWEADKLIQTKLY
jgi:hypothetical protein